jgi:uncharacterized damage-inducible protein DinB
VVGGTWVPGRAGGAPNLYGATVELTGATATGYARLAFDRMLAVAERLGDERVNERPLGPDTNAVAAIIVHCCGVSEFWLGHVGCGRRSTRDRDAEFDATASVADLRPMVAAACDQLEADVASIDAGAVSDHADGRLFLTVDPVSDASLVLHVIEELFQHLGHCELAADALLR